MFVDCFSPIQCLLNENFSSLSNSTMQSKFRLSTHDCKNVAFPPLPVGAEMCGACTLTFFVKYSNLCMRRTRSAHASGQDGGARRDVFPNVYRIFSPVFCFTMIAIWPDWSPR